MSEGAEHKAWHAHASEALEYFQQHGPEEAMTPEQRATYGRLVAGVQDAADRHDDARGRAL